MDVIILTPLADFLITSDIESPYIKAIRTVVEDESEENNPV